MTQNRFTQKDQALMRKQYEKVASADPDSLRDPEIRFYDFIFLREQNDNSDFLSLLCNSPEWAAIAKKSSSDAIFVTDETTLGILKSQKLPAESGIEDKSYFAFLKESGFKFATINQLIKKLPRDNKNWKDLYDKMNILIDSGTLHLASLRDFAKPIVSMGFKGDHHETVTVQKELDVIVNKELARIFTNPNDILPLFSIQGIIQGVYVPTQDGVGRILIIKTKGTHGKDAQRQRQELIEQFEDYKITSTPEIYASKGSFIYFGKCLELTSELIDELIQNPQNYQARVTRNLSTRLEAIAVINYGPENNAHISNLDSRYFGVAGTIYLNTWTLEQGGKLHGQFVKLITDPSQIDSITEFKGKILPISWSRIKSITSTLKDPPTEVSQTLLKKKITDRDLEGIRSTSKESTTCPSPQSWEIRDQSFHPDDEFLPITTLFERIKAISIAKAVVGIAGALTASQKLGSPSSLVGIDNKGARVVSGLNPPSSAPLQINGSASLKGLTRSTLGENKGK